MRPDLQWTRRTLSDVVQDRSTTRSCVLKNLLDVDDTESKKLDKDMTRYECFSEFDHLCKIYPSDQLI